MAIKNNRDNQKVKINIHKMPGTTGSDDVFVGTDLGDYMIQRGKDVEVPQLVVDILTNSKKKEYTQNIETQDLEESIVPTYPFSILS